MLCFRVVTVDPGRVVRRTVVMVVGAASRPAALRGCPVYVAEEYVGGLGGSHGEVDILRLPDRGVGRPAPGVADVVDGDFNGVSC